MKPTGEEVRAARLKAGMSLNQMADRLGYNLRAYQRKESDKEDGTQLTSGEYELMLLMRHGDPSKLVELLDAATVALPWVSAHLSEPGCNPEYAEVINALSSAIDACQPPTRRD